MNDAEEAPLQFDPWLKEILLRRTGTRGTETIQGEAADVEIPVVARLLDPVQPVAGLRIVARFGHIVTGRVPLGRLVEARRDPNVASLKGSRMYEGSLATSVAEIGATREEIGEVVGPPNVTGRGVVIGFCDWGCDFAHSNFRSKDGGTRLLALWDQRGPRSDRSPTPFGYGREFSQEDIDAALSTSDPYRTLGYDPALSDSAAVGCHGTHVMDIAAGNGSVAGSAPGVAREARLIFVHLRGDDTRPEDNLGDSVRLLEGIRYIIDKAADSPVVINCSLGRTGGPHDHSLNLTQALDSLLEEAPGRCVVMSAGNYFESGLHASGRVPVAGAVELPWHVVPRHAEFAELEVWYPGSDRFRLDLIDPIGRGVGVVRLGEDRAIRVDGHTIASIYQRMKDPNNGWNQAEVFLWPDAMVGTWRVRLLGESVRDGTYHAWIERDDPVSQSRFLPAVTSRATTTNSICNGRNTISVAAYDSRVPAHPIVPWSSGGPTRDGRSAPVLSGPGAGIRAARSSIVSKGQREMDGLTIKSGTSMAAPHVSGAVALMFEAAAPLRLSARETRDILASTARRNPPWSLEDQLRYGAGRVDASKATRAACGLGRKGVGS